MRKESKVSLARRVHRVRQVWKDRREYRAFRDPRVIRVNAGPLARPVLLARLGLRDPKAFPVWLDLLVLLAQPVRRVSLVRKDWRARRVQQGIRRPSPSPLVQEEAIK